jgi:hypothetical protein
MEPVRADRFPEQVEVRAVGRVVDVGTGPVQGLEGSAFVRVVEKKYRIRQECPAIRLNVQNADNS